MLRAPRRLGPMPKPLVAAELDRIWAWERQMIAFYITATIGLVGMLVLVLLFPASALIQNGGMLLLAVTLIGGAYVQFRERCPRCNVRLGRQARFVVPALCKSCGIDFPRNAPRAPEKP